MTQEREKQHIKGFYPGLVIPEECIEFEDEEKEKWTFKVGSQDFFFSKY